MKRYLEIKPGSISETIKRLSDDYQAVFKAELEKAGKGLAQMTDAEKKAFFNKIDKMHNAKNEEAPAKKLDDTNSTMVVKPGAPAGQEKVIRIPKEKLADYKSKGYVEAESYIPEAKKIDELTAGQKKLPPALQKAIKAKEKKEEVELEALDYNLLKPGNYITVKSKQYVIDKIDGDVIKTSDINGDFKYFKMKDIEKVQSSYSLAAEFKPEEGVEITEGGFKEIDTRKSDLKLAKDKRENLKNKYNAIMANAMQGDESAIADQIQKLEMSIKKQEQELIDMMKKNKESEKTEAVDPERVANLNQKIQKMTTKMGELDMSKPESKTKEAIIKSDITTAKLRLQDLMQKGASDMKKAVNEMNKAKQSYKSLKMSVKKEQEMNGKKKTLTDKPLTKIEVNPKIEG